MILPSKKFIKVTSIIIFLIIFSVIIIKFGYLNKNKNLQKAKVETVTTTIKSLVDKDTDKDGISDWEESLWGTNPNKIDSDDNGESDSIYIEQKRNELRLNNETEGGDDLPINDTDKLARELFSTIVSLKESNNLNEQSINDLSRNVAEKVGENKILPDYYKEDDLILLSTSTKNDLINFNTSLQKLVVKYESKNLGEEMELIASALDSESAFDMMKLSEIGDDYQNFAKDYLLIKIPKNLKQNTLDIVNNLQKTGVALKNISQLLDNPLVGIVGVSQYKQYEQKTQEAMDWLGQLLKDNDIIQ